VDISKIRARPKLNKKLLYRGAICFVLIVLCLNLASATLIGANIFDLVLYWDSDVLKIESKRVDEEYDSNGVETFKSVAEMEEAINVKIMVPHYLPEEYVLDDVSFAKSDNKIYLFYLSKENEDKIVNLTLRDLSVANAELLVEKDEEAVEVIKNGQTEYKVLNNGEYKVIV
jgi:hypothetical protein